MLELAAGTGVLTRELCRVLPEATALLATDLNQPMLDHAAARGTSRAVEWRQADAMRLPFPDESFDAVVCQFGVMFFPDKQRSFAESRRVLNAGGIYIFNVWDRIEDNEFADVVTTALGQLFPSDPPRFLARTPHGYHDRDAIERDVAAGGFGQAEMTTVTELSRAELARTPAIAYCQGTPLRNEIEGRHASGLGLAEATDAAADALERRFGAGPIEGRIQAHVVIAAKSS